MSNKISRRAFLKCAGVSAAAVGSASLLSGCKTNGSNTTVNDVKVGDTVKNWNGLGVQLSSVFHLTQDPARPGYEYLGVRVTVLNRSKTETYTIGAQGVDAINAAYPVPPLENVDANFQAMAAATTDFVATCDGQGAAVSANDLAVQFQLPELFRQRDPAPAGLRLHRADAAGAHRLEGAAGDLHAHLCPGQDPDLYHEGRRCDPRIIAFDFVHFVRYAHRMFTIIL